MSVRIVEVGPRDGLQNESTPIPTEVKLAFIQNLAEAGLSEIEATSFVSPKWVPQLGDAATLWPLLPPGPAYSALVPNHRGLERALELGVSRIALFTATSDDFTRKNINMTVDESLDIFEEVAQAYKAATGGWVRGYVSTAFECPYAGKMPARRAIQVAERLFEIGCDEVSFGDTIGVAVPAEVRELTKLAMEAIGLERVNFHFHDTRGTAIANVAEAYELGVRSFDASAAGLGGCPYAVGAGGNLATEDIVYFLERSGVKTGIDPVRLASSSLPILEALGRAPAAKAQQATLAASHRTQ